MAFSREDHGVQYVAKILFMLVAFASKSSAIKISFASQQHGSTEPPVHINLHLHLDGNKVVPVPAPNEQCSNPPKYQMPRGPVIDIDATPIATHELQKWLSEFEKVSVEGAEGVRHTVLLASQGIALDGISLLPGCVEGQAGDPMGISEDGEDLLGLGLCGSKLPILAGLGDNNQIEIQSVKDYAKVVHEKKMLPFPCGDEDLDYKLAFALAMMNTGREEMAIDILSALIKQNPKFVGAYHARAVGYARRGIQHPMNAALAIQDFTRVIEISPKDPIGWEKRAEVFSTQGRNREAYGDISKALDLRPTAKLYKYRGYMMFKEEKYVAATKDLMESVQKDQTQLDVVHLLAISLYHQGKLHEAVRIFKKALELKPDYVEVLRSLARAYRELGDYENALDSFNKALHYSPHHIQSIQQRGSLHYHAGKPKEALKDFQYCLRVYPTNEVCRYMKGLCLVSIGQYYDAVRTITKLMIQKHITADFLEYEQVKYIRELSRYLHAHLDTPFSEYSMDQDLDGTMKDRWVKNLPFQSEGYKEMPGLSPDISDIDELESHDLSPATRNLICRASVIGRLSQYDADGFLPNERMQLAVGLGSLEVAQTMQLYWRQGRSFRNGNGNRFGWKDMMDVAIKWRRYVDPDQPVLWLDQMPSSSYQAGYNSHMNIVRGQLLNIRFANYFDTVFNLTKRMIYQHSMTKADRGEERLLANLDKVASCEGLVFLVNKLKMSNDRLPGFMISTRLDSFQNRNAKLEGAVFSLSGEVAANVIFSIDTMTTKRRTEHYHTEIDYIWALLSEEMHSKRGGPVTSKEMDHESIVNLVLSMIYYVYNLMPISRGTSSVAYTIVLGLVMALGREVTSQIPKSKLVEMEALLSGTPQTFASWGQSWMNIKRSSFNLADVPQVSEAFPTLRSMLEALNVGASFCTAGGQ
ncbi:tetratricopeptide repeat protein 13-like [Lytechinus pictus]|uniref:tetratricopeptide repeat protein 13-like n=1 Tax=Lytechinus pictus TaxID=7653 RepID=UPI0030BA24A0